MNISPGLAASLRQRFSEFGTDQALPLEPIECLVEACDNHGPASAVLDFGGDTDAISIFPEAHGSREDKQLEVADELPTHIVAFYG
jgi:hypothetical protein